MVGRTEIRRADAVMVRKPNMISVAKGIRIKPPADPEPLATIDGSDDSLEHGNLSANIMKACPRQVACCTEPILMLLQADGIEETFESKPGSRTEIW